jgi:predicted metal-dependent phosphoesterase TrpH
LSAGSGKARLRMDMHLHTRSSFDCLSRPREILRAAAAAGLDRIVVTDHDEIGGALELHALDPERVLVGEEVRTAEGFDVIGILLRELIPKGTPARETCERIREQGGIVYVPHPFDGTRAGGAAFLADLGELVDVVEVHNARCFRPLYNQRASEWAQRHGVLRGAGSDAHTLAELGAAYVELPAFRPERDSLLAALAEARIVGRRSSPLYRIASTFAKLRKRLSFNENLV